MLQHLPSLIILFAVIFDPFASFSVFFVATDRMSERERKKTALLSVLVAALISLVVLLLGEQLLSIFSTTAGDFRVAGGIVLGILGIKMSLGLSPYELQEAEGKPSRAVAALIATPLLTGPAAITSIIIAIHDYGRLVTGVSVAVVLGAIALLFLNASRVHRVLGETAAQVVSTIMGLITLSWAVKFVRTGLGI